jgi:hypothetical protein
MVETLVSVGLTIFDTTREPGTNMTRKKSNLGLL